MSGFSELFLEKPDGSRIAEAFRGLPKRGTVLLTCIAAALQETIRTCENAGFFALQIRPAPDFTSFSIRAWKGKGGPCYETGRSAKYRGSALAVLDDDRHFILNSIRVCEKTGGVYCLPPYAPLIEVTDADPHLLSRLDTDPVLFNCDTFERDSAVLMSKLSGPAKGVEGGLRAVFYPGPFRLLVLDDGSVVRRGVPVRIAAVLAEKLVASDGLLVPVEGSVNVAAAEKYQDLYATRGAAGVFDDIRIKVAGESKQTGVEIDSSTFASCLPELREQLRRMVERNAPYVVFSGSDPADPLACCPSEQVGQANRLSAAGVLCKYAPPGAPDACTTTFFACAGEIEVVGGEPVFSINAPVREKIGQMLGSAGISAGKTGRSATLRLALIMAILLAFAAAAFKFCERHLFVDRQVPERIVADLVGPDAGAGSVVAVMFHGNEECGPCVNMRKLLEETVAKRFAVEVASGKLKSKTINYDDAGKGGIRRWLGMTVSTVGLFGSQGANRSMKIRMLTDRVWALHDNDALFGKMLDEEIRKMLLEVGDAGGAGATH